MPTGEGRAVNKTNDPDRIRVHGICLFGRFHLGHREEDAMPHQPPPPTPEERNREVAKLLAAGLLRFYRRVRPALPAPSESAQNQLDECRVTRLHGATVAAG